MSTGASRGPTNPLEEIRRQAARSVLDGLQTALGIINKQANCIRSLQNAITQDKNAIDSAAQLLVGDLVSVRGRVQTIYHDRDGNINKDVGAALQDADGHLAQLSEALNQARTTAKGFELRHVESTKLKEWQGKFEKQGKTALIRETQGDPLKQLKMIWEEGLDLLSGLCLRIEGLDRGLCRFADAIIAEIRWRGTKAMTVPGRGGPGHLTSIIHLRFPEWTVWALPLTAHELWHLERRSAGHPIYGAGTSEGNYILESILETLGRTDPEAEAKLREDSVKNWNNLELQRCLADVFGVHVMGPAYACAAIWLVLDPHETESQQRAQSILRALGPGPNNEYDEIHRTLDAQWRQASKDSGAGELQYADWIDALLMYLDDIAVSKFYIDRWSEVREEWSGALLNGEIGALHVNATDFRYALTAAWKARLEWHDQAPVIAENCSKLCEKILSCTVPERFPGFF